MVTTYEGSFSFLRVREGHSGKLGIGLHLFSGGDERGQGELLENPFSQLRTNAVHSSVSNLE